MAAFVNLSVYQFVPLQELASLRERLRGVAAAGGLKGTILLSPEGFNVFVAGPRDSVDRLLAVLRALPGVENLAVKESLSAAQPFGRMLVKIKKEIISFGVEGIDPARNPARKISPETLKEWLDAGRPMTLLDTRNDYEVRLGTFRGATAAGIDHFREVPAAVRRLPDALKAQPLVMFCTGGIRCEKAGPFMMQAGFSEVVQLDGGILNYFEKCGGAHYEGECFVFDERVGVDPHLRATGATLCTTCQEPVSLAQQHDARFQAGVSCPRCFETRASPRPTA